MTKKIKMAVFYKNTSFRSYGIAKLLGLPVSYKAKVVDFISTEPSKQAIGEAKCYRKSVQQRAVASF